MTDYPTKDSLWISSTHWGRVTHICVSNLTTIGSDNGLSPGRRQAIIQTNAGILLTEPLGTNFNEILIEIHIFSFIKIHFKMSSGKWRPFCLGLNVLKQVYEDNKGKHDYILCRTKLLNWNCLVIISSGFLSSNAHNALSAAGNIHEYGTRVWFVIHPYVYLFIAGIEIRVISVPYS